MKKKLSMSMLLATALSASAMRPPLNPGSLSNLQVKYNQLVKANPARNEAKLCEILETIFRDPIYSNPKINIGGITVQQWVEGQYAELARLLDRPPACAGLAQLRARLPQAIPQPQLQPAQPQQPPRTQPYRPEPQRVLPTPSAPELPAPIEPSRVPLEQPRAPRQPIPSAPELPERVVPVQPLVPVHPIPSAPPMPEPVVPVQPLPEIPQVQPTEEKEVKIAQELARPIEVAEQVEMNAQQLFNEINNIIAHNTFKDRNEWPLPDQQRVEQLIQKAQPDREFSLLLTAYFQDYATSKKRAQLALQTEQAINFLFSAGGINAQAIQGAQEKLNEFDAKATAKALQNWFVLLQERLLKEKAAEIAQPEQKAKRDQAGAPEKTEAILNGDKKQLVQLQEWETELQIPDIYKDPQTLRNLLANIQAIHSANVEVIKKRDELIIKILQRLKEWQSLTDQQIIDEIFDYLIVKLGEIVAPENRQPMVQKIKQSNLFRTLIGTLTRILRDAETKDIELNQQRELIGQAREHGSGQIFELLQRFKKEEDIEGGLKIMPLKLVPEYVQLYNIPIEQRTIKRN